MSAAPPGDAPRSGRPAPSPTWEVLQGTPVGASAMVDLMARGHRLELAIGRSLFLPLDRLGGFDELASRHREGGEFRLLLEYDPHQQGRYRALLTKCGGVAADRVRFLMTSPPQFGLNDQGDVLYEIISGRSREGGQMVLVRTRGVPGSEERRREFELLWRRALPASALLRARRRSRGRDPGAGTFSWTCPACGEEEREGPSGSGPFRGGPVRRGSPRR